MLRAILARVESRRQHFSYEHYSTREGLFTGRHIEYIVYIGHTSYDRYPGAVPLTQWNIRVANLKVIRSGI